MMDNGTDWEGALGEDTDWEEHGLGQSRIGKGTASSMPLDTAKGPGLAPEVTLSRA